MKKAWIENGRVRDVCPGNPDELYHPDVAQFYTTDVPDDAENGDGWDGSVLTKPEPPAPPPPAPRTISADDVRKNLTLAERVKWDSGKPDEVATVKIEFASPRTVEDATELLQFMVDSGVISRASMDKVLA